MAMHRIAIFFKPARRSQTYFDRIRDMMKPNIAAILKSLPDKPGVYIMRDAERKVIYIGKAKRLKRRVLLLQARTFQRL